MTTNIQISKKLNDDTIVVIGGATRDEFFANVTALLGADASTVLDAFGSLVPASASPDGFAQAQQSLAPLQPTELPQAQMVAYQQPPQQWAQPAQQAPQYEPPRQASGPPPGQNAPQCVHGTRQFKSGVSQGSGKQWKAWMCPAPKGESCDPSWIR